MGRPTNRSKINEKISESMRQELKSALPKLKDAASQGMRQKKQYEFAGISERTYYRWLEENPELKQELAQLLTSFRKTKIREAAMIGAPQTEQRLHANKMTEMEYHELMDSDPDFFEEVEMLRESNLKIWARKNIAESIQNNKNVGDSWRFLEHMDKEMNKKRLEISDPDDDDDRELIEEYETKVYKKLQKKIQSHEDNK